MPGRNLFAQTPEEEQRNAPALPVQTQPSNVTQGRNLLGSDSAVRSDASRGQRASAAEAESARQQVEWYNSLDRTLKGPVGRGLAASASAADGITAGALPYMLGALDNVVPGTPGSAQGDTGDRVNWYRDAFQQQAEQHPVSSTIGKLGGFMAGPGRLAYQATRAPGEAIVRAIPGTNALAQAGRFTTRLAGSAVEGLKQAALYEATVGASDRSNAEQRGVGLGERAQMATDTVTDPLWGPVAAAAGPLSIMGGRGINYLRNGRFTPRDVPGGVGNAPSIDEIEGMKQEAYRAADEMGIAYTPDSFADLVARIETRLMDEGIDPVLHQRATRNLKRIQDRVGDQPMTLQELDRVRQFTRRDVVDSSRQGATPGANAGEMRLGQIVMDEIDDFIESGMGEVSGAAAGQRGADAILRARSLNTTWRKAQMLQNAEEMADLRTKSTGSGGNYENALRQEIRKIYTDPRKSRAFSEAERKAMRAVIDGGSVQNLLRLFGKLSPQSSGLMAGIGVTSSAANPVLLPLFLGGMVAKRAAEKGIKGKFDELDDLVRSGAMGSPSRSATTPGGMAPVAGGMAPTPGLQLPPVRKPRLPTMPSFLEKVDR